MYFAGVDRRGAVLALCAIAMVSCTSPARADARDKGPSHWMKKLDSNFSSVLW